MFGESLRIIRRKRNITQVDLAKALGVTQQTIGKWETGAATPNLDTIGRIAKFFDVPVSYFIEGAEQYSDIPAECTSVRDNVRKGQIKAIGEFLSAFQYTVGSDGVAQTLNIHRETILAHLETNPKVMQIVTDVFQIVADSLAMCAMEMSKVTIDRSIAAMTKQPFDAERAIEEASDRVAKQNDPKVDTLLELLRTLPEAMFDVPATAEDNAGGELDGEH